MKPIRDEKYLAWIRTLPCVISGRRPVEAHHAVAGTMAQKASDLTAIPLIPWHHRLGPHAVHNIGRPAFARRFALDIPMIIARLNEEYLDSQPIFGQPKPWSKITVEEWPGIEFRGPSHDAQHAA